MKTNTMFLILWYPRMISFIFLLMLFQFGFSRIYRDSVLEVIAINVKKDFLESQVHEIIIYLSQEFHTIFIGSIKPDSSLNQGNTLATSLINDNRTDYVSSIDSVTHCIYCPLLRKEPKLNL